MPYTMEVIVIYMGMVKTSEMVKNRRKTRTVRIIKDKMIGQAKTMANIPKQNIEKSNNTKPMSPLKY